MAGTSGMKQILLRGGRVIDPASGRDAIGDVLLEGRKILWVSDAERRAATTDRRERTTTPDPAVEVIDVAGLVVGPGFIDLHSHAHTIAGHRLQAMDGVTTALDLEAGLAPVDLAYRQAEAQGRPLNFGFSASWAAARSQVLLGAKADASFAMIAHAIGQFDWRRTSTSHERERWLGLLEGELAAGALGIGVLQGYAPESDPAEYLAVAELAGRAGSMVFTHARELIEYDPLTPIDGSLEIVRAADETGAAMHHCHVTATSRRHVDRVLGLITEAQRRGSRITLEAYPYGSGATAVGAAFLAPSALSRWGLGPENVVMLATGERPADADRLNELRALDPSAACVLEYLDERNGLDASLIRRGLSFPDSMVASDAVPLELPGGTVDPYSWPLPAGTRTHPRSSGTFAKALRLLVREYREWDWIEAFRRCSLLQAELLGAFVPAMRQKGRVAPGFDADVVVLDPDRVTDLATYADPTTASFGVRYSLVNGEFVVRGGELVVDALPGRAVRS